MNHYDLQSTKDKIKDHSTCKFIRGIDGNTI